MDPCRPYRHQVGSVDERVHGQRGTVARDMGNKGFAERLESHRLIDQDVQDENECFTDEIVQYAGENERDEATEESPDTFLADNFYVWEKEATVDCLSAHKLTDASEGHHTEGVGDYGCRGVHYRRHDEVPDPSLHDVLDVRHTILVVGDVRFRRETNPSTIFVHQILRRFFEDFGSKNECNLASDKMLAARIQPCKAMGPVNVFDVRKKPGVANISAIPEE